jgi:murein hydrolase activator
VRRIPAAVLLLIAVTALWAKSAGTDKEMEAKIRRLASQVADIAQKQQGVLDRLALLRRRVRLSQAVLKRIHGKREALSDSLKQTRQELDALQKDAARRKKYLEARMRQCYALGLLQNYRVYFAVGSVQDLREAGIYLSVLSRRDQQALEGYRATIERRRQVEQKLASDESKYAGMEAKAKSEYATLLGERSELHRLLAKMQRKGSEARSALQEQIAAARSMTRYLKDYSFKKHVDLYSKNMVDFKGDLAPPVKGKVVKGFGDTVNPRFLTRVPHPGLDMEAPLGTPVHSVFAGVVAYADWLTGYGYTVILSHPGGYFTVYSRLDEISVKPDQIVKRGQVVGAAGGDVAQGVPGIYFELRLGDHPLNPAKWLKGLRHGSEKHLR